MWTEETAILILAFCKRGRLRARSCVQFLPTSLPTAKHLENGLVLPYYCFKMKFPNCSQLNRFISVRCGRSNWVKPWAPLRTPDCSRAPWRDRQGSCHCTLSLVTGQLDFKLPFGWVTSLFLSRFPGMCSPLGQKPSTDVHLG